MMFIQKKWTVIEMQHFYSMIVIGGQVIVDQ